MRERKTKGEREDRGRKQEGNNGMKNKEKNVCVNQSNRTKIIHQIHRSIKNPINESLINLWRSTGSPNSKLISLFKFRSKITFLGICF